VRRLGKKSSPKGMVVTASDLQRHRKAFRAYSLLYRPYGYSHLDGLIPSVKGYMLVAALTRRTELSSGRKRA